MGAEAVCSVHYQGAASVGTALLETSELIFRGDFRLRIPFASVASLRTEAGKLHVGFQGETAVFELGPRAEQWAAKIRNPRGLLDKLGVKPEMSVAVVNVQDDAFVSQLKERTRAVQFGEPQAATDLVFYEADTPADLDRLTSLRERLKEAGGMWVVSPKGKGAQVKDTDVMAAARAAGLVDNKVAAFSATHTALKLVIPRSQRG